MSLMVSRMVLWSRGWLVFLASPPFMARLLGTKKTPFSISSREPYCDDGGCLRGPKALYHYKCWGITLRIKVIYNGQDVSPPIGLEEKRCLRAGLGLEEDEQVVGVVGSLYPVKGHEYLLAAIPQVLRFHPHTTFLIVGRGDLRVAEEEAKQRGLEKHVRFLGFREDVSALLSLMGIFVLPSLSEGLSIALLEAMASGKPVIATDVGGNPEVVVDDETGFLVPPRDADALAAKLLLLLADERYKQEDLGKMVEDACSSTLAFKRWSIITRPL